MSVAGDDREIGELIKSLVPDPPWIADVTTPSADAIRERVCGFTDEQRAAAEREAFLVEYGDVEDPGSPAE